MMRKTINNVMVKANEKFDGLQTILESHLKDHPEILASIGKEIND